MQRSIAVFNNDDEFLVAEYPLYNIGTDVLRLLWNCPSGDPMPMEYPIEGWMWPTLLPYLDIAIPFEPDRYSYFVSTSADYPGEKLGDYFLPPRTLDAFDPDGRIRQAKPKEPGME